MENKPTHTPTPRDLTIRTIHYQGVPRYEIATQFSTREQVEKVVQAVNSHQELLAAIRYAVQFSDSDINPTIKKRLEQAIAKAEGL